MASHNVLQKELTDMGFEVDLIDKALKQLGQKATIESVIELITQLSLNGESNATENKKSDTTESVVKEKTDDNCRNSEIELKQRQYEEKIKQRRLRREAKEREEELKKEIKRRTDGQGIGKLKEELQQLERKRIVEEMRREKAEQKAQKEAVLERIAADRRERRNRNLANSLSSTPVTAPPLTQMVSGRQQSVSTDGKCRLAIRLLDGKQLIQEFDGKESLSSVRVFVITQACIESNISFVMPPLPSFTEDDMQKPLNLLGLCPSARVHVIKR